MILLLCGALAIGASLGLLGSGGSILTVPVLLIVLHRPEKLAIAESLAIVGGIACIGSIPYAISSKVHWPSILWFGLTGMVGAYLGAYGSHFVTGEVQLLLFAVMMFAAAYLMLSPPNLKKNDLDSPIHSKRLMIRNGFFVGGLTGFLGIGGGFLIVPALVLLGNLPIHLAIGTSLVIIALNALTGFISQLFALQHLGLQVDWRVIALVTPIGIFGSLAGSAFQAKIPDKQLRWIFGTCVALIGIYIVLKVLLKG